MPHISIYMYPGRTKKVKQEIANGITDYLCEKMGMEKSNFSVSVGEIEKEDWRKKLEEKTKNEEFF